MRTLAPLSSPESLKTRRSTRNSSGLHFAITQPMPPKLPILIARLSALVAIIASGVLVLGRTTGLATPGCGPDSGCAIAAASRWATVPLLGTSTASMALSAFMAMSLGLFFAAPDRGTRWIARACALGSAIFIVISTAQRLWCPWCLASHAGSLAAWASLEIAGRTSTVNWHAVRTGMAMGVAVAAATFLSFAERRHERKLAAHRDLEATESIRRIAGAERLAPQAFAGRYSFGAESPKVRVVVFTGYQCPDCRMVDSEIQRLVGVRGDTSLSLFHFPFCSDCNPAVKQTIHPNACQAALAAEAAGIAGGNKGFWAMHRRLFELGGAFSRDSLSGEVRALGLDGTAFFKALDAPDTLELVKGDAQRAIALGLNRTPTVFVNGTELRGWNAPDAIARALDAAARSSTPASADKPRTASERALEEWRLETPVSLGPDAVDHHLGAAGPQAVVIDLFGDYQDDGTVDLDARIRALVAKDPTLAYHYRHFPGDSKCNPAVPRSLHPLACRMARSAEAFAVVGGEEAFWAIHEWTLANHRIYSDAGLRSVAEQRNLDWSAIIALRDQSEAMRAVAQDVALGQALKVTELPWVLINGKRLAAWKSGEEEFLRQVIEAAKLAKASPAGR